MGKVLFDSSLAICVSVLKENIDSNVIAKSVVIRDINGNLGVVINAKLQKRVKHKLEKLLSESLQEYAQPYNLLLDSTDFSANELLEEASFRPKVTIGDISIGMLDRRAIGVDWMSDLITNKVGELPCFVFGSIKGGVGRSTALCVAASHLSQKGCRVLAIDFDLEAPGIGSLLLRDNELPPLGCLDYLVETQIGGFDSSLANQMVGGSFLGLSGARVDIVPAIGKATLDNPQNALAKIARAYLEISHNNAEIPITIGGKLRRLIQMFADTGKYDVVLIDSRAGLHETTAAALLAVGGELLLFGTDQEQTYQGYKLLLGHLSQFDAKFKDDFLSRTSFVHAKSRPSDRAKLQAESRFRNLYLFMAENGLKSDFISKPSLSGNENLNKEDIDVVWTQNQVESDAVEIPDFRIIHIYDDSSFADFDPLSRNELLTASQYGQAFSELTEFLDEAMAEIFEEDL